jgi:chromosomal replication initiation ATPase DnaA
MTPEDIIRAVCDVTGITREALVGDCRMRKFSCARYLAWGAMRDKAGMNCAAIGRIFRRDHSTVIRGFAQFERLYVESERFRLEHEAIIKILDERLAA